MDIRVGLWSLLVAGAACGSSSPTGSGGNPPAGPVADVSMTDNNGLAPYAFSPAMLPPIKVGTSVRWTNNGKTSHTATSDATSPVVWNSGTVAPAGTTTCTPGDPYCTPGTIPAGTYVSSPFNTPGTYQYHCEFHGVQGPNFQGMTGTINVTQ